MLSLLTPNHPDADTVRERLISVDFLVLDDLGAHRATDFAMEQVFSVVNTRDDSELPTLFTSNIHPRNLASLGLTWQRVADRIGGACGREGTVVITGESARLSPPKEKQNEKR
jgi:DNA replication protein DnaC